MGDATHHGTIERQVSVRCDVGENVVDSEERIGDTPYLLQVARNDCDGVVYFAVHLTAADGDPIHVSCVAVRESDRRFVVVPEANEDDDFEVFLLEALAPCISDDGTFLLCIYVVHGEGVEGRKKVCGAAEAAIARGAIDEAIRMLEQYQHYPKASAPTGELVQALALAGDVERLCSIVPRVQEFPFISFEARLLLQALVTHDQYAAALPLVETMRPNVEEVNANLSTLDDDDIAVVNNMVYVYANNGQEETALEVADQCIAKGAQSVYVVCDTKAMVLLRLGRMSEAEQACKLALGYLEAQGKAPCIIAAGGSDQRDTDGACVPSESPEHTATQSELVVVDETDCDESGAGEESEDSDDDSEEGEEHDMTAIFHCITLCRLAHAHNAQGEYEDGLNAAELALSHCPSVALASGFAGDALLHLGRKGDAAQRLREGIKNIDANPVWHDEGYDREECLERWNELLAQCNKA